MWTLECHWNATGWPSAHWDTTGRHIEYLQGTLEHHWKNLIETGPHWNATGETLNFCSLQWNTTGGTVTAHAHTQAHIIKQSSIHASKWQDDGAPFSKWTGLCKFRFYLEFTGLQWIPLLLLKHVSTSTSLCACLWYEHHYSFFVIWGQMKVKWNQFSSNNSHHTSCIH